MNGMKQMKRGKMTALIVLALTLTWTAALGGAEELGQPMFDEEPAASGMDAPAFGAPEGDYPAWMPSDASVPRVDHPQGDAEIVESVGMEEKRPAEGRLGIVISLDGTYVSMHYEPRYDSLRMDRLTTGETILLEENKDGWWRAFDGELTGYIEDVYILVTDQQVDDAARPDVQAQIPPRADLGDGAGDDMFGRIGVVVSEDGGYVNMRSAPSMKAPKETTLYPGNEVMILTETEDGWYQVTCNNHHGYVMKDFLAVSDEGEAYFPVEFLAEWENGVPELDTQLRLMAVLTEDETAGDVIWRVKRGGGEWQDCGSGKTMAVVFTTENCLDIYQALQKIEQQ